MSKIPFVVQPRLKPVLERIGSEDAGYIEIERRGFLTVGEKSFVQTASSESTASTGLYTVVTRIASEEGKEPQAVLADLQEGIATGELSYLANYASDIAIALEEVERQEFRQKVITSASLLISRVSADISTEDVMGLHPDILRGLDALYADEDKKAVERLEQSAKDLVESGEESEGK